MRKMILVLVVISSLATGGILAIMAADLGRYRPPTPAWFTGTTEDKMQNLGLFSPLTPTLCCGMESALMSYLQRGLAGKQSMQSFKQKKSKKPWKRPHWLIPQEEEE